MPFVDDVRLLMRRGQTNATGNWYCGLFEAREMAFALHVIRPGEGFVDVGANVGAWSLMIAGATGGVVEAFEPGSEAFGDLRANVRLNDLSGRVSARRIAIGERHGQIRLAGLGGALERVCRSGETPLVPSDEIEMQPLDAAVTGGTPFLLKCDVEGFEMPVLRGARRMLRDSSLFAVIIETNGSGRLYSHSDAEVVRELVDAGFTLVDYDPRSRVLSRTDRVLDNSLFVRDVDAAQRRVTEARRFRLVNGVI